MNNSVLTIIKLNLKNIRAAYIVTIAGLAMFIAQIIIIDVLLGLNGVGQNTNISASWALWALPVMAAILIPARHFRRVVSLGGKRDSFFRGCFLTYLYLAGLVSLIVTIYSYTIDQVLINSGIYAGVITVPDVFGWSAHGPVLVFVQQFAFLFLTAAFVHLLTAMQGKWYGFALDAALIAIICVFTPIEPLRAIEAGYFQLILFHPNALLQIGACIVIGIVLYVFSKPVFARKPI